MNFVSIVTIFVTLLGVARPGEIEGVKPDVEHALPILVEPDPNNEPTHGTCYNNCKFILIYLFNYMFHLFCLYPHRYV